MAEHRAGGEPGLVGGVLDRFQPHVLSGEPVAVAGGVADCQDFGNRGAHRRVDPDAIACRQAGRLRHVHIGRCADADDNHLRWQALARTGDGADDPAIVTLEPEHGLPGQHAHAGLFQPPAHMGGDAGRDGAAEQPIGGFHDCDPAAAGRQCRGDLQPDEAAAEDHHIRRPGAQFANEPRIGERTHGQCPAQRVDRCGRIDVQRNGFARDQHQRIVLQVGVEVAEIDPDRARRALRREREPRVVAFAREHRADSGVRPVHVLGRGEIHHAARRRLAGGLQVEYGDTALRIRAGEQWQTIEDFLTTRLHFKVTHGISDQARQEFVSHLEKGTQPPKPDL